MQDKYDPIKSRKNKSIGETINYHCEFVLRIITSQGIIRLISAFLSNLDKYNVKLFQAVIWFHTNLDNL